MFAIITKVLYQKRFGILGWTLGAITLAWVSLLFYPAISAGNSLEQLSQSLPPQLQSFMGDLLSFKTVGGYLDTQIFGLRMPMITVVLAIILGLYLSAGDEERGTMATLLAQPISRTKVLFAKFAALKLYLVIVHVGLLCGVQLALWSIHEDYSFVRLIELVFGCYVVSLVFGAMAFSLGLITGRKGLAAGVTATVALGSYIITSMAQAATGLQTVQKFLPFYYYTEPKIGINGLDWSYIGVQVLFILALLAIAWAVFKHRDLQSA
jgi:ABC-2 type transport system permease protein